MDVKKLISYLMDVADVAEKAKLEIRALKESRLILNDEQHEIIKDLLLIAITDLETADSDIGEYERLGFVGKSFAVKN